MNKHTHTYMNICFLICILLLLHWFIIANISIAITVIALTSTAILSDLIIIWTDKPVCKHFPFASAQQICNNGSCLCRLVVLDTKDRLWTLTSVKSVEAIRPHSQVVWRRPRLSVKCRVSWRVVSSAVASDAVSLIYSPSLLSLFGHSLPVL